MVTSLGIRAGRRRPKKQERPVIKKRAAMEALHTAHLWIVGKEEEIVLVLAHGENGRDEEGLIEELRGNNHDSTTKTSPRQIGHQRTCEWYRGARHREFHGSCGYPWRSRSAEAIDREKNAKYTISQKITSEVSVLVLSLVTVLRIDFGLFNQSWSVKKGDEQNTSLSRVSVLLWNCRCHQQQRGRREGGRKREGSGYSWWMEMKRNEWKFEPSM